MWMLLAGILPSLGGHSFGQASDSRQGFDAYRILVVRNIFDPDRLPMASPEETRHPIVEPAPKAGDYVTLTGVMFNEGKGLAFFSGSRAEYDRVTGLEGEIAGAKVTGIAPSGIEVSRGGKKIVVAVGQTVPFDDSPPGRPPSIASEAAATSPPEAAPSGGGGLTPAAAPAPLPGNLNEVMRRMMERRQHELQ